MDRSPARFHRRQNNNDGDQTRFKVGARAPVECCGLCANCGSAAAACIEDDATGVVVDARPRRGGNGGWRYSTAMVMTSDITAGSGTITTGDDLGPIAREPPR